MRSERSTESRKPPLPPVVTWKHIFVNSHIWALEIAIGAEEENPYLMCQDPARKTEISCAFKSAEPSFWKMATPVIEERRNQTRASEVVSSSHYLQPLTRLEGAGATEETLGLLGSSPRPERGGEASGLHSPPICLEHRAWETCMHCPPRYTAEQPVGEEWLSRQTGQGLAHRWPTHFTHRR